MADRACYFASDLHLTAIEDANLAQFLTLCQRIAVDGRALYLLGDLFEAYLGDDDDAPLMSAVAEALRALSQHGVEVAFAHGNRDFLLRQAYLDRCGARLLAELECIDLGGRRIALLHGDSLCRDDVAYQAARQQLRSGTWQAQFLAQPLAARRAFAQAAREQSAAHTASADLAIMDVNAAAVAEVFAQTGADWMVHGHTHRPAVHAFDAQRRRIVLGDWPQLPSCLRVDGDSAVLEFAGRRLRVGIRPTQHI